MFTGKKVRLDSMVSSVMLSSLKGAGNFELWTCKELDSAPLYYCTIGWPNNQKVQLSIQRFSEVSGLIYYQQDVVWKLEPREATVSQHSAP